MANKIVNKGDSQFAFLTPVPTATLAKSWVAVGKIRGLTRDNSRIGKDGLSYAVVGTNDLIAQTLNSSTWATGDPVYATAGGVLTQSGRSALPAPVVTLGATATTGGTFAAGAEFWKITALGADGETIGSNEVTATLVATGTQVLNWTAITGATGFKVYRGVAAGAENVLVATLGVVATYTDTGAAGTAASVPTATTLVGIATRPATGVSATVFVQLIPSAV